MTGPNGDSEFCFPERKVEGKQNSLFPAGPVIKCFVIPPNSKLEKTAKKSFALPWMVHKFAAVSRSTTWSRESRKFVSLFPWEFVSFVRPRELLSFDPWHVTRSLPIGKRIWVGRHIRENMNYTRPSFEISFSKFDAILHIPDILFGILLTI